MKVKEFIEKSKDLIKSKNINSLDKFIKVCPIDNDIRLVSSRQDPVRHHFYEIATNVYMLEDGFVGITGGSKINIDSISWNDINELVKVNEYEAFPSISYRIKHMS